MIPVLGSSAVLTAVAAAGGVLVTAGVAARAPRWRPLVGSAVAVLVVAVGVALAALWAALLTDDFSVGYVAENHASDTPLLYTIATAWAGLEGSLLVWSGVLVGFLALLARQVGARDRLGLVALTVVAAVTLFFLALVATAADPFTLVDPAPADGPGPNPLLQNHVLMAVHPPLLYVGYIGLTVPFGFGVAALVLGQAGRDWIGRTRTWTLVSWVFLTAGVLVGGLWSYEVLGWGGYWAWDPVENASLLPWLTATAFLHSSIVQERRGLLRSWNVILILVTFLLTVLGTFITRSGVISSVHSFTQSEVGPWLLGLLVAASVLCLGLYAWRAHELDSGTRIESMASREGAFLANNLLLSFFAGMVLLGTMYPVLVEAASGAQVSVGRPFFDRFSVPIGFALLAAMGTGPLLPYRASSGRLLWQRLRPAVIAALVAGLALLAFGVGHPWVVLAGVLATFVAASVVVDARRRGVRRGRGASSRSRGERLGWWGGQVAHVGVALMAFGIAVSGGLSESATGELRVGEPVQLLDYELTFQGVNEVEEPNRLVRQAPIEIVRDGRDLGTYAPSLNAFRNQAVSIGTPSVRTTFTEDVYLALRNFDDDRIDLEVIRFPFMWVLWVGAGVLVAGGGVATVGRFLAHRSRPVSPARQREEVSAGG